MYKVILSFVCMVIIEGFAMNKNSKEPGKGLISAFAKKISLSRDIPFINPFTGNAGGDKTKTLTIVNHKKVAAREIARRLKKKLEAQKANIEKN